MRSIDSRRTANSILPPINNTNPNGQKPAGEVLDNDLMNQSTIKNFIGKAFKTIDLKAGMKLIEETRKAKENNKMKKTTKRKKPTRVGKSKLKLRNQDSEVVSAASFLESDSGCSLSQKSEASLKTDKSFSPMTQLGSEYTPSEQAKYETKKNRLLEKKAVRAKSYMKYVQSTREGR